MKSHVAVLGTGSWGTTFAKVIADAGYDVVMWGRNAGVVGEIDEHHTNVGYLPGLELPRTVAATSDVETALSDASAVVLAIPSQSLRQNLTDWGTLPAVPVISLMKGIERGTDMRMSEVIAETGAAPLDRIVVVSGPNLAREIALGQPCASVVAAATYEIAEQVAGLCRAPYFRPYLSTDLVGVEVCGAVKNVIALAVGMAQGVGMGDNTKATIITRGLAEITRLGLALGALPETFAGLAGLGDLVATCASPLSRNQRFGSALGRGLSVDEAQVEVGQTAEGVGSCAGVLDLGERQGVDLPITRAVNGIVHDGQSVETMMRSLLSRPLKTEGTHGRIVGA